MTIDGSELFSQPTFPFPKRNGGGYFGESVNWNKYAPPPDRVHELGCLREAAKRAAKPDTDIQYFGFIEAEVRIIRSLRTARGHMFSLEHVPSDEEGQHRAEVYFLPNLTDPKLRPTDREELRELLVLHFSPIVKYSRPDVAT